VTEVGDGAADEFLGCVAKDAGYGGGDVEEGAFEGEDVDEV